MYELYLVNNTPQPLYLELHADNVQPVRLLSNEHVAGPWHPQRGRPQRFYVGTPPGDDQRLAVFLFHNRTEFTPSFFKIDLIPRENGRYYVEVHTSRPTPHVVLQTGVFEPTDTTWPWWACALLLGALVMGLPFLIWYLRS